VIPLGVLGAATPRGSGAVATYLDELAPLPVTAVGLKKLISTATLAIRVRRSSDNVEQDIGFDGDDLDATALAAFVGTGDGFVRTIYDQTGNGYHAQQATSSKQAKVVNGGTILGEITLDGSDDTYQVPSLAIGTQFVGLHGRLIFTPDSSARIVAEASANYISNSHTFVAYAYSTEGGLVCGSHATENNAVRSRSFPVSGTGPWSVLYDRSLAGSDEIRAWRDGAPLTGTNIGTTEQTGSFGTHNLNIGARNGSSLYCALKLGSLAIYSADKSSVMGAIEQIV
jgi:hypothetical protein